MTPQHYDWSVWPWGRYDADPPEVPPFTVGTADGTSWVVSEPMDPKWHAAHWHHGAEIHDGRREINYRATVDARGELDYLEVVLSGRIVVDGDLARLSSVPVDRIRTATNAQAIHDRRRDAAVGQESERYGDFSFVLPGGLADGDGSPYSPPSREAILAVLSEHPRWWRKELSAHYRRPVRTVDRWLRKYEIKRPRKNSQTPGGDRQPGQPNK
ncbi:MAG: hypothetical protein WKF50_13925 [Nocardioides sp.]